MSDFTYLFDASAVVPILNAADYDTLFDEATVELMLYEATNAIWKEAAAKKKITREEGAEFAAQIESLAHDMHVYTTGAVGTPDIYETAWDTGLTAYDSTYVTIADQFDLTLVTEDGGIHENAPPAVDVIRCDEL